MSIQKIRVPDVLTSRSIFYLIYRLFPRYVSLLAMVTFIICLKNLDTLFSSFREKKYYKDTHSLHYGSRSQITICFAALPSKCKKEQMYYAVFPHFISTKKTKTRNIADLT